MQAQRKRLPIVEVLRSNPTAVLIGTGAGSPCSSRSPP